jgi:hypothetical protein
MWRPADMEMAAVCIRVAAAPTRPAFCPRPQIKCFFKNPFLILLATKITNKSSNMMEIKDASQEVQIQQVGTLNFESMIQKSHIPS